MSGKFRFISLTDSSLLIQDSSDTGIQLSSSSFDNLSFLDIRITHEQLLKFFMLDESYTEDFFSRIVTYRRKFSDEVFNEDSVKLAASLATEFEELLLEDSDFSYIHNVRRLPQDNILFTESALTPRVATPNELLFLSEKVGKRLPNLIAKHATADEKTAFEYIVEFFDERLDLLHIQNTRPKEIVEIFEVLDVYRFVHSKERVYTEQIVTKARGLQAKHETQLVDPFGDGSVPQKPGFDHIVELLDDYVDIIRYRAPILEAVEAKETFVIPRIIEDPRDQVLSVVQELLKLHKKINLDPTVPSSDIAYLQTQRGPTSVSNFIDFYFFKNLEDSTELLENTIFAGLAQNLKETIYSEDTIKNLVIKDAPHATNTSGKPGFDFIVETDSLPRKKVASLLQDDSTLSDILLRANSNILRDRVYQEDSPQNLVKKPAKHSTNTSGKPDFDYIVEVNAQRNILNSLTNFVNIGTEKGVKDSTLLLDNVLAAGMSDLVRDRAYASSSNVAKLLTNYYKTIQNTLEGTVEGYESPTQDKVGATVRRYPTTLRPEGGFVDLGPNKVKSEKLVAADEILDVSRLASKGNGLLDKVYFNEKQKFVKFIDKTVPVYFSTTFIRTGNNAHSPGSPKIRWLNNPSYDAVDPYYIERQEKLGLQWIDTASASHWLDGTNSFTPAAHDPRILYQTDSGSREDFVLFDDGHGKLAGDFTPLEGTSYKVRVPRWVNQYAGWQFYPGWVFYDTLDVNGKRILHRRDYQQLINSGGVSLSDTELGRTPNYVYVNGSLVQQGYLQRQLVASGKTIFEKLNELGILGGTFSLKQSPINLNSSAKAVDPIVNLAGSTPAQIDRVGVFFYPLGQQPEGEPEDVIVKRIMGPPKEFIYVGYKGPIYDNEGNLLAIYDLEKISKFFSNSHKKLFSSLGKTLEGIVGAAKSEYEAKSHLHNISKAPPQLLSDRPLVRSRRAPENNEPSDIKVRGGENKKEVIYAGRVGPIYDNQGNVIAYYNLQKITKSFKNTYKKNILYFSKIVEAIENAPNEKVAQIDTKLASALGVIQSSRAFVTQDKFSIAEYREIREEEPNLLDIIPTHINGIKVDLNAQQPSGNDIIRRWGEEDIYISYTRQTYLRTDQGGYSYTGFNTYTANNPLSDWQRTGYGPTIYAPYPYGGQYNYSTGVAWNGDYSFDTYDSTPYYYNSTHNTAFLFSRVTQKWVFVINFNTLNEESSLVNSSNVERPLGSFTVADPVHGGVANVPIVYNTYRPSYAVLNELVWYKLGSVNSIYEGNVQYSYIDSEGQTVHFSHNGLKLYTAADGHLYMPVYRSNFYGLASQGPLSGDGGGYPPMDTFYWVKVSDKTFADIRPTVNEIIAPVGVQAKNTSTDKTFFQRKVDYRKTHTETVQAADLGSAFIPVYCASYFLEPYVSEAGKFANF